MPASPQDIPDVTANDWSRFWAVLGRLTTENPAAADDIIRASVIRDNAQLDGITTDNNLRKFVTLPYVLPMATASTRRIRDPNDPIPTGSRTDTQTLTPADWDRFWETMGWIVNNGTIDDTLRATNIVEQAKANGLHATQNLIAFVALPYNYEG